MDATINMIRTQRNMIPVDLPSGYVEHMQTPVRFIEEDEMDKLRVGYRSMGPDDFFMAELYDLVATELFWMQVLVNEARREDVLPLDDLFDFERCRLGTYEDAEYRPGPPDIYHDGFGEYID
jgi:hypothetical protein